MRFADNVLLYYLSLFFIDDWRLYRIAFLYAAHYMPAKIDRRKWQDALRAHCCISRSIVNR